MVSRKRCKFQIVSRRCKDYRKSIFHRPIAEIIAPWIEKLRAIIRKHFDDMYFTFAPYA